MKQILIYALLLCLTAGSSAQSNNCGLTMKGRVVDRSTQEGLMYANIFIQETSGGAASDSSGYFTIPDICPGAYHLRVSHLGCETESFYIELARDTTVTFLLHHHHELLDELVVHGHLEDRTAQASSTLDRGDIKAGGNQDLSEILENISGVTALKSGSGISKPVIHGLYGNRVSILNNGLVHSGQQWGNDHAPEIDPFVADHISVVKGASALAYGGNSLGSIVLIEPGSISDDPHIHGEANYIFNTNGLGHTINGKLEKHSKWAAWKVLGTIKLQGDSRSPDYYLTNTGKREYNGAVQFAKSFDKPWKLDAYYSIFHTQIAILRGSHIGNITDLLEALEREEPFYTEDHFKYDIEAPSQTVNHHLIKLEAGHMINEKVGLKWKYGGQINQRDEFDVRRAGRSDIPSLSLLQQTHFIGYSVNASLKNELIIKTGIQYNYQYNKNNPETGVLPLIPDYKEHLTGIYLIFSQHKGRLFYEAGARYDLKALEAITITREQPYEIARYNNLFHNVSVSGGLRYKTSAFLDLLLETGFTQRSPEVNELYSFGLHQGVSGIEEGRLDLNVEHSYKTVLSAELKVNQVFFLEALAYYQQIWNYIYLEPQEELRLTIRGSFQVFKYEQTNARISGLDLLMSLAPADPLKMIFKYSLVRGRDLNAKSGLINIPADRVSGSFTYAIKDGKRLKENELTLNGEYIFKQNQVEPERYTYEQSGELQEVIIEAPEGYFLLGFSAGTKISFPKSQLGLRLEVDNMLNTTYRDYLNRQRYFADDTGVNVSLGLSYEF